MNKLAWRVLKALLLVCIVLSSVCVLDKMLPPRILASPFVLILIQVFVASVLTFLVCEFLPRLFCRFRAASRVRMVEGENMDTEVQIYQNALDFSNVKIRDCIVPRPEVVAIGVDQTLEELKGLFVESGLSKIIVYEDNIDNVVGYIHSSEMFRNPPDWRECVKPVPIVPETMPAHNLMKLFMQQKKTLAVVVDEFGGTSGIVSLEDLVEEILGDIEDEHDNVSYICKQVAPAEYVLSARLEISKVNETFGLDLPESDDYMTIGGLILSRYQKFPKPHEVVAIGRYSFKILRLTATKIELVRLKVTE